MPDWADFQFGEIRVHVNADPEESYFVNRFDVTVTGPGDIGDVFSATLASGRMGNRARRMEDAAIRAVVDLYEYAMRGHRSMRPDPLEDKFAYAARELGQAMLSDARSEVMRFLRRRDKRRAPKDWIPRGRRI